MFHKIPFSFIVGFYPYRNAFVTAFGFTALGLILLKKGKFAIKIAQMGTILYIGFAVFNGIGIQAAPGNPFNAAGMFCYTVGAILLGFFILGERLSANHFLGMAAIGAGLAVIDGRPLRWLTRRTA